MSSIGQRLGEARKKAGFTQKEAAQRLNIPRNTLATYERDNSIPSIERLTDLAVLYGVTERYIVNGESSGTQERLEIEFADGLQLLRRANDQLSEDEKKELLRYMQFMLAQKKQ